MVHHPACRLDRKRQWSADGCSCLGWPAVQPAQDCPSLKSESPASREVPQHSQTRAAGHPVLAADDGAQTPQGVGLPREAHGKDSPPWPHGLRPRICQVKQQASHLPSMCLSFPFGNGGRGPPACRLAARNSRQGDTRPWGHKHQVDRCGCSWGEQCHLSHLSPAAGRCAGRCRLPGPAAREAGWGWRLFPVAP